MTYKTLSDVPALLQEHIKRADGYYERYERAEYPCYYSIVEFNRALDLMRGFPDAWPEGVEYWAQDGDDKKWFPYTVEPKKGVYSWITRGCHNTPSIQGTLIGDFRTTLRKRPENESKGSETMKNKPNEPEWLENPMTGECPVPVGDDVEFKFHKGGYSRNPSPDSWFWSASEVTHYRNWSAWEQGKNSGSVSDSTAKPHSKYQRNIKGAVVDVYDVLEAFDPENRNSADDHAIKKMLLPGKRGVKGAIQDRKEAIQSLQRSIEIIERLEKLK